jgi:hypothetical protein
MWIRVIRENAQRRAQAHGIELRVVKHTEAKRGFILLPRRWVRRTQLCLGRSIQATRARLRTLG